MKQTLMLVGGGVIATHYKRGLENSDVFELVALADIDPACHARALFDVPFYPDWQTALKQSGARAALLSTPPAARYEIARELLRRGVAVITEKPMCDSLKALEDLFALSDKYGTPIGCLLHWAYADETLYLKAHLHEFGRIKCATVHIFDDYAQNGSIRPDRRVLGGAWRDSGINALSFLGEICDLSHGKLLSELSMTDSVSGQDCRTRKRLAFGDTQIEIEVDWSTASREKYSRLECENGLVEVDHLRQTVRFNGETVYANPIDDRLSGHYENTFAAFRFGAAERERVLRLHTILFGGDHR